MTVRDLMTELGYKDPDSRVKLFLEKKEVDVLEIVETAAEWSDAPSDYDVVIMGIASDD